MTPLDTGSSLWQDSFLNRRIFEVFYLFIYFGCTGSSCCTRASHPRASLVAPYRLSCPKALWEASLVAQRLKRLPAMQETLVRSLSWEDPLAKEMATHSSILAWRIPWRKEPGRLQSTGSQRVGHDWATSLSLSLSLRKDQTCVSCAGRWILNPWTTREVLEKSFQYLRLTLLSLLLSLMLRPGNLCAVVGKGWAFFGPSEFLG